MSVELLMYKGVNRHGMSIVGRGQTGQSAADMARKFYDQGWKRASITGRDGREVGAVTRLAGKRTWWGEGDQPEAKP